MLVPITISILGLIIIGLLFGISRIEQDRLFTDIALDEAIRDFDALEETHEEGIREARASVGYFELIEAKAALLKANKAQKIPLEVIQDMKLVLRSFKIELFKPEVVAAFKSLETIQELYDELCCDVENFDDKELEG